MRKYKIIDDPKYFSNRSDSYPIPYRCVILHAMYHYTRKIISEKKMSIEQAREKLDEIKMKLQGFIDDLQNDKQADCFNEPGLFDIYILNFKNKNKGALFVDRSDGVYPLVFYPENDKPDSAPRKTALINSLVEVLRKWNTWIEEFFVPNAHENTEFEDFKDELCSNLSLIEDKTSINGLKF